MHKLVGRAALLAGLAVAPTVALAQHAGMEAKHEFGADIGGVYAKPSGGNGVVVIATPVDLRVGFMAGDKLVIEPRISFGYNSKGGIDFTTLQTVATYRFIPDVNALWAFQSNKKGPYLTVGAGVDIDHTNVPPSGAIGTASQFGVNGGLGTRVPYESGAIRLEAFGRYFFKNTSKGRPNQFQVGARIGLSLWH